MTGRAGAKFWVSHADHLRLKPIYDELNRREIEINQRIAAHHRGGEEVEAARLALDRTSESRIDSFNAKVDRLNSQNDILQAALEDLNRDIRAYNEDLERVGRLIR